MAITTVAPVAPAAMVTKVLDTYRDTGLGGGAITTDILGRMGMGDEIARRVLQALRLLEYTDDNGQPTKNFLAFRQAPNSDYQQVFADQLYDIYAPIFAVTGKDLAGKTPTDVEDAFRSYSPASLRKRMVTLFLGLCQYAGIADRVPTRKPGPKRSNGAAKPAVKKVTPKPKRENSPGDPLPPPPLDATRQRYVDLLIEKAASQDTPDQDLLDRIERALGIGGASP